MVIPIADDTHCEINKNMKRKDQVLLEQAYVSIYESSSVLIPRRNREERSKNYNVVVQKQLQQYIKNGCEGDLDLASAPITSLPEELTTIGGSLYLNNTPITSLPQGLKVGRDLGLANTKITSLPEGLTTIGGSLNLSDTSITSLPEGLKVGGSLYLSNTKITSLPEGLKVGRDLSLFNTPISEKYSSKQLKQMLPNVKGGIYI